MSADVAILELAKQIAVLQAENDQLKADAAAVKARRPAKRKKADIDAERSFRWSMSQWAKQREKAMIEYAEDIEYIRKHEPGFEIDQPDASWYTK